VEAIITAHRAYSASPKVEKPKDIVEIQAAKQKVVVVVREPLQLHPHLKY
jgi:hypothetical protein